MYFRLQILKFKYFKILKNVKFNKKFFNTPLKRSYFTLIFGFGLLSSSISTKFFKSYYSVKSETNLNIDDKSEVRFKAGDFVEGLPEFTIEEVSKHNSSDNGNGIWVTYKNGVYDITKFVDFHPGGKDKIMLAKGGSIDSFQSLYSIHNSEHICRMLERYRIGNLKLVNDSKTDKTKNLIEDPFANDPQRHPALKVMTQKPFNAESPSDIMADNFFTPNDLFYVRNHLPVPQIDPSTYRLSVESSDHIIKSQSFSIEDLRRKFPKHTVSTTTMCAGNRRNDFTNLDTNVRNGVELKGILQNACAISTAQWSGVLLSDLLSSIEKENGNSLSKNENYKHICFESFDDPNSSSAYGSSIPLQRAYNSNDQVLIAYEMNGKEIPPDHGFPVRVIVPGVAGARCVKQLGRIIISDKESPSLQQRGPAYRIHDSKTTWANVSESKAPPIYDLPVISAILRPLTGSKIDPDSDFDDDNKLEIKGYAYSGGGHDIDRVEVSVDGGKSWKTAELCSKPDSVIKEEKENGGKAQTQKLQKTRINLMDAARKENLGSKNQDNEFEIICRARDSSNNVQPEHASSVWNLRGLLCNSQHRVKVFIDYSDIEENFEEDENNC